MGQSWSQRPHTLAQFARRVGISEGRARALYHAVPSGLPKPDTTDAEKRPLWWAATIDAWCKQTHREVAKESLWIFRAPDASSAPVELRRGTIPLSRYDAHRNLYVIVWDTDNGHVIYLQRLGDLGNHRDQLAVHAAELIEPHWWSSAVVVIPLDEDLHPRREMEPRADLYRLTTCDVSESDGIISDSLSAGLRRLFTGTAPAVGAPAQARAEWVSQLDLAYIAKVLGTAIPVWVQGTETVDNAERTLSYNRTFIVPDTTTEWPTVQTRLEQALKVGMPAEFPAAFATLAVDAAGVLRAVRTGHAQLPDTGEGWYLVCRPAKPAPPIELEQIITAATLVTNTDLVAQELTELRMIDAELDTDDPRSDPYAEAITLLSLQLRQAAKNNGTTTHSHQYVPVADDDLIPYHAPWQGHVVDAWLKNLIPVESLDSILRLRRVRNGLLDYREPDIVQQAYRDKQGRYVLVVEYSNGSRWGLAEWPKSLKVVSTWTDKTVLAADDTGGPVTLLALTPTDDGRIRTDPVPLPPFGCQDCYAYGYSGGTAVSTYRAILRCALGDIPELIQIPEVILAHHPDEDPVSQLWQAISTTRGPLRMSWPQVQMWARADRRNLGKQSGKPRR
jgi:hypothetical protein